MWKLSQLDPSISKIGQTDIQTGWLAFWPFPRLCVCVIVSVQWLYLAYSGLAYRYRVFFIIPGKIYIQRQAIEDKFFKFCGAHVFRMSFSLTKTKKMKTIFFSKNWSVGGAKPIMGHSDPVLAPYFAIQDIVLAYISPIMYCFNSPGP